MSLESELMKYASNKLVVNDNTTVCETVVTIVAQHACGHTPHSFQVASKKNIEAIADFIREAEAGYDQA